MRINNKIRKESKFYIRKLYLILLVERNLKILQYKQKEEIVKLTKDILNSMPLFFIESLTDSSYADSHFEIKYPINKYVALYLVNNVYRLENDIEERRQMLYEIENIINRNVESHTPHNFNSFVSSPQVNIYLIDYMEKYKEFF